MNCYYRAEGWCVVGSCPEAGVETAPMPGRNEAERELERLINLALRRDEYRCLSHRPTGEAPP